MTQMFFFDISSINLVAIISGYIQSHNQFDIMSNKQKLFTYGFKYFNVDEKSVKKLQFICHMSILSRAVYRLNIELTMIHVKLNEKMILIEQTYKWDKLGLDFRAYYRDKNLFFIYKNG